ncbi:MAG: homocysteine biosynthesis protein, partial [Promethearchaeota archaeon]
QTNYAELKSGEIELNGKKVKTTPTSSLHKARIIANELKRWIKEGKFTLNKPLELLPTTTKYQALKKEAN